MSTQFQKSELNAITTIFDKNNSLTLREQKILHDAYYALKIHMPDSIFKDSFLKTYYNKGLTYIACSYKDTVLFKIYNNNKSIKLLCPALPEFIYELRINNAYKENLLKACNHNSCNIELNLSPLEVLQLTPHNWSIFTSFLESMSRN